LLALKFTGAAMEMIGRGAAGFVLEASGRSGGSRKANE